MAEPQLRPLVISELNPPMNITLVQDGSGLEKLKKAIARIGAETNPTPGLDTETNVVPDFWFRRVRTLQIGDKNEQFVIDLLPFAGSEDKLINSQGHYGKNNGEIYKPILEILDPVLCSNKFLKVGQNLGFEYEIFNWHFGRRIWHLYSTDLAERVIQAGAISLKKYSEFSMAEIVKRRFGFIIDKSEQEGFDLKSPLTQKQIEYAALDIRMPLAMRLAQLRVLTAEQLLTTSQIEFDALGSYVDMHLVGQNMDDARWLKRIEAVKKRRIEELNTLDQTFVQVCGHKDNAIDHERIAYLENILRTEFESVTPEEMAKAAEVRSEKDKVKKDELKAQLKTLEAARRAKKAAARTAYSELSKDRTAKKKILEKCEGQAFLNYGSNDQMLEALKKLPGFKGINSVADDVLLKYNDRPFVQVLRRYRKGKKETGTYGEQWTRRWVTKPCKEEGFRHPGDGRLHCLFNQLEAETGRSSSSKPNAMNLPKDDEVRACFICDPPDENIRISTCCNQETTKHGDGVYLCKCGKLCETVPEEYCIVTVDMSGAELRIIAELAGAKSWITAFAKNQDVHSVSTEILYPEKWPSLACKGGEKWFDPEKNKEVILPPCAYYQTAPERKVLPNGYVIEQGEPLRQKCKCPGHLELRNGTKATNFLLCYGGGPDALADELGVTIDTAKEIMQLHESKFPDVWGYLRRSGEQAKEFKEARDMYGRRRLFLDPTPETAREWFIEYEEEKLELSDEDKERSIFAFKARELREPTKDEIWSLTHRAPTGNEIRQAMRAMMGSIGRKGKNHCIQGTNASIIKRSLGCGFDRNGKGYLWHTLPQYKARIQNMVHDELVVHCPKRYGQVVADLVGDAFKRAAAEVMHSVIMEHEAHIAERWMK
jgi:DNA polymerase I-like protein with 3'-5' exonuclease and polymerase domains